MGNKTKSKYVSYQTSYKPISYSGIGNEVKLNQILDLSSARTASDDPMWQSKVKAGTSATNFLSAYKIRLAYQKGKLVTSYFLASGAPANGLTVDNSFLGINIELPIAGISGTLKSNSQNMAAIQILSKIRDETTAFSGPTFLGELRDTLKLIRSPAKALREKTGLFLSKADETRKRAKRKGDKPFSEVLAESYLEYAFGVAPLIGDITAIANAALPKFTEPRIKRISASSTDETALSENFTASAGGVSVNLYYNRVRLDRVTCKFTVGLRIQPETANTALERVIALGGFNLQEVIPTAWELLPWSFFIDYFSNIGDVLSASLVSRENIAWTQRTFRSVKRIIVTGQPNFTRFDQHYVDKYTPMSYVSERTEVLREAASIPKPELRFELPGLSSQFINIAALARLQFK